MTWKPDTSQGWRLARVMICLACLHLFGCDTRIDDYIPRTNEEQAVISVLIQYQEAKNRHDIAKLMPLLHDNGEFSFACGIPVSKAELEKKLPEFWSRMESEKLAVVPMAHECLNGDYYSAGVLKDPLISVSGNTARARVWFTQKFWSSLLLYFRLVREGDQWLITKTQWGPS